MKAKMTAPAPKNTIPAIATGHLSGVTMRMKTLASTKAIDTIRNVHSSTGSLGTRLGDHALPDGEPFGRRSQVAQHILHPTAVERDHRCRCDKAGKKSQQLGCDQDQHQSDDDPELDAPSQGFVVLLGPDLVATPHCPPRKEQLAPIRRCLECAAGQGIEVAHGCISVLAMRPSVIFQLFSFRLQVESRDSRSSKAMSVARWRSYFFAASAFNRRASGVKRSGDR